MSVSAQKALIMSHANKATLVTLTVVLVEINRVLRKYDLTPNDFLVKNPTSHRWQIRQDAPKKALEEIQHYLDAIPRQEILQYHSTLIQFSSCFTDDMGRVVMLFRLLTPSASVIEKAERENFQEIENLPENTVIESKDLITLLKKEDPFYLRRLVMASLQADPYYFNHDMLPQSLVEEMENIQSTYLTTGVRLDTEVLRAITRVDRSGTSIELGRSGSGNDRIDFVAKMLPSLMAMSNFSIQSKDYLSRFVFRLPVMASWVMGDTEVNVQGEQIDEMVDIFYAAAHFKDLMQERAVSASRIWSLLHLGHPVYKELLDFAKSQNHFMSNAFEGLVTRFAHAIPTMAEMQDVDHRFGFLLRTSNILNTYANHKGAYIARNR